MGSWNETCMVTNLPIFEGNEIIAFVIAKPGQLIPHVEYENKFKAVSVYSTDEYVPASFAIHGYYDDSGKIKINSEKTSLFTLENLGEKLNIPFKKIQEYLNGEIRKSRLENVAMVYMHKFAYDTLRKNKSENDSAEDTREKIENMFIEYEKAKESSKIFCKEKNIPETDAFANNYYNECIDGFNQHFQFSEKNMIKNIYKYKKRKELIEVLVDFVKMSKAMNEARIKWYIPCGSGSQSSDFEIAKKLITASNTFIKNQTKKNLE